MRKISYFKLGLVLLAAIALILFLRFIVNDEETQFDMASRPNGLLYQFLIFTFFSCGLVFLQEKRAPCEQILFLKLKEKSPPF